MSKQNFHLNKTQLLMASVTLAASLQSIAADIPLYKPSSRSPEAIDISSNAYGASALAPTAVNVGDAAPKFSLPISGGGIYHSHGTDTPKPLAIVFYRGHW